MIRSCFICISALAHRLVALEAELFAESGVGFAGGVLGVDGELEFAPAPADLGALVFQAVVHIGVRGLAGSSGSEPKAGGVGKMFFQPESLAVHGQRSVVVRRRRFISRSRSNIGALRASAEGLRITASPG